MDANFWREAAALAETARHRRACERLEKLSEALWYASHRGLSALDDDDLERIVRAVNSEKAFRK